MGGRRSIFVVVLCLVGEGERGRGGGWVVGEGRRELWWRGGWGEGGRLSAEGVPRFD